jgi:hypothetical protein
MGLDELLYIVQVCMSVILIVDSIYAPMNRYSRTIAIGQKNGSYYVTKEGLVLDIDFNKQSNKLILEEVK